MKIYLLKDFFLLLATCLLYTVSNTQVSPEKLQTILSADYKKESRSLNNAAAIKEFYTLYQLRLAWVQQNNINSCNLLLRLLSLAPEFGLNETDYQAKYIQLFKNKAVLLSTTEDSIWADILITDAALHFYHDIAFGNRAPVLGYNGLSYKAGCHDIPALLAQYISTDVLHKLLNDLSPPLPEINLLLNKIRWYHKIIMDTNFQEVIIKSATVITSNKPLLKKLYQLGLLTEVTLQKGDTNIKQKIKEAQRQFNLMADGVLRSTTLQKLNIPLQERMQQLMLAVNYYRWLYCLAQDQPVIVVNIPSTILKVYKNNEVILQMRIIAGKKATPTPALASKVNQVILYPYWHVPNSIAIKEILPAIKRNPGYIDAGNYQVLNATGKIMDPYSIDWKSLNSSNFPYLIRQSTGCDNALGLLKLNFYSPYGVYLHDTPSKGLFMMNKRFFSHGCMRMEKPMELGYLVLKNNRLAIDTLDQKGCLRNQAPITVPVDDMPVIVWYNPAGIDITGRVIFYEDVYQKLSGLYKK